ncbi:MAG TPA: hypothetical protein VHL55_02360 [Acidimicrobiia bacterium]|jgi:hypothetical protein|nr:hypothetical protein [Acidimicrobiia bacterium]
MKLHRSIAWFLPVLVLFACGSGGDDTTEGSSGATTVTATATSQTQSSSPATTKPDEATATSAAETGGTGSEIGVTLSDGSWTGGTVHVEMSGDATGSFDAELVSANSITDGQSTTLYYVGSGGEGVGVAIYPDSWAISVTTPDLTGGGGTTTQCRVNYQSTEDSNVGGEFSCPDSPVFTLTGATGTATFVGSFDATR